MVRLVPWMLFAGVVAACGGGPAPSGGPSPQAGVLKTILQVENLTFSDLTIYVLRDNQRQRLGRSTANTTTNFTIPPDFASSPRSLRFITDPVGPRREAISQDIYVAPGDTVFMRIGPF
ncbi:MAG TPA: hypothetical protein VLL51_04370 [Gemmatimonadales bacterium]|nr:hypothetical protein [Gemmatimonadales bacterium]